MAGNLKDPTLTSLAVCLAISCVGMATAANGQESNSSTQTEGSSYVCMMRAGPDAGGSSVTRIKVPQAEEQWLLARGFRRSGCGNAEKWLRTIRPSMCAMAEEGDPAFASQVTNWHGLSPAEICSLAAKLPGSS